MPEAQSPVTISTETRRTWGMDLRPALLPAALNPGLQRTRARRPTVQVVCRSYLINVEVRI